jgi:tetraacyldisaccharide-1-P 4'-kinase
MLALISIAVLLLWLLYKKLTEKFKHFEDRGVKFEEPVIVFGNVLNVIRGKQDLFSIIQTLYDKFHNEK